MEARIVEITRLKPSLHRGSPDGQRAFVSTDVAICSVSLHGESRKRRFLESYMYGTGLAASR